MKIAIGSDHAGFALKKTLKQHLIGKGHELVDVGVESAISVDYPDYGAEVARRVSKKEVERGILVCGTGIGMAIVANKFPGVRAAVVDSVKLARLSREHNDANVLALGGRIVEESKAIVITDTWLETDFAGGRHNNRLEKIANIESEWIK